MNLKELENYNVVISIVPKSSLERPVQQTPKQPGPAKQEVTGGSTCELCETPLKHSTKSNSFYCPNFKDKSKGEHTFKKMKG